ncbi:FAD-dependent oxidoreductase [Danxiaibacter flavus]|uniref:FAD-dependent oxidoreductase n=1 Tax=Danxiaibacter flavus TaxID=3049108 RepID=A0ABV3ZPE6_9BACT|nr:FAD-dependent oxidoreductase [Chitinophagaceae bacterium DXS]
MQISIWEKESFFANRDILIIGAGLVGLWTAYEIKKRNPSINILIIEKGIVPTGASTRNAGFACFGSPTELLHDFDTQGKDDTLKVVEMRFKGIEKIKRLFVRGVIDYDNCGGFECLDNQKNDISAIKSRLPELNLLLKDVTGASETYTWADEKLDTFGLAGFDALIENGFESSLHSGKLLMAFVKFVQSMGVDILPGVEVAGWTEVSKGVELEASYQINNQKEKLKFFGRNLIVCCNAFTNSLLPELKVSPERGQVIVTSPIPHLPLHGTFHYDEGFYYFRNIGNRILLGGARNSAFEEEHTDRLTETPGIQKKLEDFLRDHIAGDYEYTIDFRWSGIMGFTQNKQPVIHHVSDRVHAVVSCNGMGVALSPVVAEKVAESLFK